MLFGAIKVPGEHETVTIEEWIGKNFVALATGGAVGFAMGNFVADRIASFVAPRNPRLAAAVGMLAKGVISGITYYLPRRAGETVRTFGLGVSIGSFMSMIFDIVNLLTKGKAQEFGAPSPSWYVTALMAATG